MCFSSLYDSLRVDVIYNLKRPKLSCKMPEGKISSEINFSDVYRSRRLGKF